MESLPLFKNVHVTLVPIIALTLLDLDTIIDNKNSYIN